MSTSLLLGCTHGRSRTDFALQKARDGKHECLVSAGNTEKQTRRSRGTVAIVDPWAAGHHLLIFVTTASLNPLKDAVK